MVQENSLHRKRFLQLSARMAISLAGLLGLGGLARYFSHHQESGKPSRYELGAAADFPATGKLIRVDIPAVIYQTSTGFQAYSLVCTHLGCTLEEDSENFSCPCHGSEFDRNGIVLIGPADQKLPELEVTIDESGILILNIEEDW